MHVNIPYMDSWMVWVWEKLKNSNDLYVAKLHGNHKITTVFFHKIQFYNILYNYIKYITEFKFERIEEFFLFNIAHSSYISLKFLHGFLH